MKFGIKGWSQWCPLPTKAMFVMKSIASVWLSFDFVNRNLEERRKFGRDYNKRATIRCVQPRESFLLRKQRGWRGGGLSARWWSSMMERYWGRGGRSRNPYLWWHNTWTAHFGAWSTDSICAKFPIEFKYLGKGSNNQNGNLRWFFFH